MLKEAVMRIFLSKPLFSLFLVLSLGASSAWAKAPDEGSESNNGSEIGKIYLGVGTGADLPGSNWNSDYYVGGGAGGFVGYQLDKNLAGQVAGEEWFFTGGGSTLLNFRILVEAKYIFEGQGWQPYVLAGPGFVFQTLMPTGDNTTNFDALAGLGAQFDLAPKTRLFIEAKYNLILPERGSFADLPVSAGLSVGL